MQTPTTDQLRDRIDKGLTGEKVSMRDPAAAPLGTDAEAAGVPPTARERALDGSNSPEMRDEIRAPRPGLLIYLSLVGCVSFAFAIVAFLALR